MLYLLYTSPLEDIVKLYNLDFHFYANDTPLYLAFKPNAAEQPGSIARIEASVCGIGLMDGAEKVEVEQAQNRTADLSAHHRPRPSIEHIDLHIYISSDRIQSSSSAKNIDVICPLTSMLLVSANHAFSICAA